MGTTGYERAAGITYRPGEVILEVGSGYSTHVLAQVGPDVWTIDPNQHPWSTQGMFSPPHVHVVMGYAENVLRAVDIMALPIGFAWLDGWDFPYDGVDYTNQQREYEARGQSYSQEASRQSHLLIAQRIGDRARVIAFDDTWRTHAWTPGGFSQCQMPVPPATMPAPRLAMDQSLDRDQCLLLQDHPHHNDPERGWDGKGGEAVPWLLQNGYAVVEYGLGLVVVERTEG